MFDETYNLKQNKNIYFAGQITGVEGYVESIASGMVVAINAATQYLSKGVEPNSEQQNKCIFPKETVIGALSEFISSPNKNFQPMNANFGILPELEEKIKDKKQRYEKMAKRSMQNMTKMLQKY